MRKSLLTAQLTLAVLVLALLPSPAHAADNFFIQGLSTQIEDYPSEVRVGDTFTTRVNVVNQSGQEIDALLMTYLYSYTSEIAYPIPTSGRLILVNEGGLEVNETSIELGGNENKVFALSLTVRSDVQLVSNSGGLAKLMVRIRRIENNRTIILAPTDNRYIIILPKAGPEEIAGVKFGVGAAVTAAIVWSVVTIKKRNSRGTNRRGRK